MTPPRRTTTRQHDVLWDQCCDLARSENILALFTEALDGAGVAGEQGAGQLLYLIVTSRLLDRPVSAALKGASSVGKSYTLETVLRFFPPASHVVLSSMSERAAAGAP